MSAIFAQPQQKASIVYFAKINEKFGNSSWLTASTPSDLLVHISPLYAIPPKSSHILPLRWESPSYIERCEMRAMFKLYENHTGYMVTVHTQERLFRRDLCNGAKLRRADLSIGESHYQGCQLSRRIRETPDFEPFVPVSTLESGISRIIAEVCKFLVE